MALNFEKYAQEGNEFVNRLAAELGHPEEIGRTGIILRAVLHTLRERITISQSFHIMSQIPMFLKAIYVENWKFREKPMKIKSKEEFTEEVKKHQDQYGEQKFNWEKSTEEIVQIVISELRNYISEGEFEDIVSQLPNELKEIMREA
jgi:uncharacterized protein (DUF2267 family)